MKHTAKVVLFLLMVWTFCFISPCLYAGEDLININTATLEELIALPGVGKTIAQRIKKYREEHPFESKEEIMEIKGIGKVRLCWFSVNWNFSPSELEKKGLKTEVRLCQFPHPHYAQAYQGNGPTGCWRACNGSSGFIGSFQLADYGGIS